MSKSGINGNRAYEDDDEEQEGLSSRSARRASQKRLELNDIDRKGVALNRTMSSGSAASSSTKDRPWRTSASGSATTSSANDRNSSSMDYVTAEDDLEDDLSSTEERLSTSGIEVSRNQSTNSESSVEVSTPTRNRWAQYETDDLAEESRRATSNAVVDMATKYADRQQEEEDEPMIPTQPMGGSASDSDPWQKYRDHPSSELESNGNSLEGPPSMPDSANSSRSTTDYVKSRFNTLMNARKNSSPENRNSSDYERNSSAASSSTQSDHDKVRNEALKMLQIADNCLMESPRNSAPNSPRSSINGGGTAGLFRTKGGGLAMRELHNDEISGIRTTKREKASALAGLDRYSSGTKKGESGSRFDGTFTIGSQDEDDLKAYNSNGTPLSPNDDTPSSSSRRWSSRFSVEHQLMAITGGLDSTAMLNKMDILNSSRDKTKSARGLYRASGYAMDGSHENYNDYTATSSTGVGLGGIWLWLRGTLWSDDLELNHDGTTQSLVRREKAMQRRRRLRWGLGFLVGLCVLVGVLVEMGNPGNAYKAGSTDVNFYVLADEPYDFSNVEQLTRELEALPESAEFVIHLGNANSDSQSRCKEYGFERAAAILKESPVPVLVIPGDLDWAACGSKKKAEAALSYWDINLGQKLEKNWDHPFDIEYSDDVIGNFAFLHKGVLFISVSIVDAETEPTEVTLRLEQNVLWTKSQLSDHDAEDYRAVVIFGHAPPSSKQGEYFWPLIEQIKDLDKPVLYMHANSDGSFEKYTPFSKAENFQAVQLEQRGREAPMRVVVNSNGDDAFEFERRDPTIRTEKN